jgi:hypothetical protein
MKYVDITGRLIYIESEERLTGVQGSGCVKGRRIVAFVDDVNIDPPVALVRSQIAVNHRNREKIGIRNVTGRVRSGNLGCQELLSVIPNYLRHVTVRKPN